VKYVSWDDYVRLALSYAVFERNRDGTRTVEVPILAGCVTWGETREEAAEMAEDAVKGWILTALRFGDEMPIIDECTLDYAVDVGLTLKVAQAQAET